MKRSLITILALAWAVILPAQGVSGTWSGSIKAGETVLELVFNIGETSVLDVPAQGAKGIPVTVSENGAINLKLQIPSIGASYEGIRIGNTLTGTFTQMGQQFPLTLTPGAALVKRPQTPKPPYEYDCEEVTFSNGDIVLHGTLTSPKNASAETPAVLLVTGSGWQNRDEEIFDHKPFAVIADALTKAGIAVLRYDDRCEGNAAEYSKATTEDLKGDAAAGIEFLRGRGYGSVGLLGHSEGGTIAFMLGSEGKLDFAVSMAGMAETGERTLLRQLAWMAENAGVTPSEAEAQARQMVDMSKASADPWTRFFLTLDPQPYISGVSCPLLALGGEKDRQVFCAENLEVIRTNLPSAKVISYPGLNHLFQHCDTGAGTEYYSIEETIAPEVLQDIIAFIKGL